MSAEKPQVVYRRDYRPPDYRIESVDLDFDLREDETLVRARLAIQRDAAVVGDAPPLVLAGQGLETLSLAIDGRPLAAREYGIDDESLEISLAPFTVKKIAAIFFGQCIFVVSDVNQCA